MSESKHNDKMFFGVTYPKRGEARRLAAMNAVDRGLAKAVMRCAKLPKKKYRLRIDGGDDRNFPYVVGVGRSIGTLPKEWR